MVGVRGAPKPPPMRISLTLPHALHRRARCGCWSPGADKADAVRLALGGAGRVQVPAAGVQRPVSGTLWLLDRAAAGDAAGLGRLASP